MKEGEGDRTGIKLGLQLSQVGWGRIKSSRSPMLMDN